LLSFFLLTTVRQVDGDFRGIFFFFGSHIGNLARYYGEGAKYAFFFYSPSEFWNFFSLYQIDVITLP